MIAKLKKLSPADDIDIYNMLQEMPKDENGFMNGANGLSYDDYKQWLIKNDDISNGIDLEDWMVAQNIYWLYIDGEPVGVGKLRLRLTDKLRQDGGNCGYGITASKRGNGYGKILLKLLVEEARTLEITPLLLTMNTQNETSIKTALANGGTIEKTVDEKNYIWIH